MEYVEAKCNFFAVKATRVPFIGQIGKVANVSLLQPPKGTFWQELCAERVFKNPHTMMSRSRTEGRT